MMAVPREIAFSILGPIAREDLEGLCRRVCDLLDRTRPAIARCDVGAVEPDAVTVDALARLQLAARRYGCRIYLSNVSRPLGELVSFLGLEDVLLCEDSGL